MDITRTIHVVDDEDSVRESLRFLLQTMGFEVMTYETASAFLTAAADVSGCVLTDVKMPGMNGLELQTWLCDHNIQLPVIIMTGYANVPLAVSAMKLGAIDFLEKPFDDSELLSAVQRGLRQTNNIRFAIVSAREIERRIALLTRRETEVFDLLVVGMATKEIANNLRVSPRTIEVHRSRVFKKLHAKNLPELVRMSFSVCLKHNRAIALQLITTFFSIY